MSDIDPWWVNGTLFENCNCQLLCPAHISFRQDCQDERCVGFWAGLFNAHHMKRSERMALSPPMARR